MCYVPYCYYNIYRFQIILHTQKRRMTFLGENTIYSHVQLDASLDLSSRSASTLANLRMRGRHQGLEDTVTVRR